MLRTKILRLILWVLPAAVFVTAPGRGNEPPCNSKPGATAPAGSHWYYRINHADKRHCWYLGGAGAHVSAHMAAAPAPIPAVTASAAESAQAEHPKAGVAQPLRVPVSQTQPAPAEVASAWHPTNDGGELTRFAERWLDLPASWNLDSTTDPAMSSMSSSYAETATDTTLSVPVIDGEHARNSANIPFRSFSIAGLLAIPLLLIAGVIAKLTFRPQRHPVRTGQRYAGGAAPTNNLVEEPPTLTDPARDLKKSLAELMGDLRRVSADLPLAPATADWQSFAPARAPNAPRPNYPRSGPRPGAAPTAIRWAAARLPSLS
jgi:hypothetical protein